MGHDAFERGYKRPSLRLHLIIFLTIIGVSVFLSSQVEKSKDKTRVEALKVPVPIDSVFLDENGETAKPRIEAPKVAQATEVIKESDVEYQFDDGSSLAKIDSMLAKLDGESAGDQTSESSSTIDAQSAEIVLENDSDLPRKEEKVKARPEKEQDLAIMVTDDVDATIQIDNDAKIAQLSNDQSKQQVEVETVEKESVKAKKVAALDAVYELQQDRFLETLAKTANVTNKETLAVKRIKEAIRSDKPLNIKSTIKAKPESDKKSSVIKVASTTTSGVIDSKEKSKPKTIVAKAKPVSANKISLTKSELNNVLTQFARSYNKGDIGRLMALFDENAITNDQKNKLGIQAEYDELFKTTSHRAIKIGNVRWNLGKDKAKGDAKFTVTVRPTGSTETAQIEGKIEIVAIKENRGVYIKQLLHQVTGQ